MKKRKTNQLKLWAIGVLAIVLLAAAPSAWAQYYYVDCYPDEHWVNGVDIECGEGSTHLIDTPIDGLNVWSGATVNLYVSVPYIYVDTGGILNIYAGSIDGLYIATVIITSDTDAIVTVYGTDFEVDWNRDGTIVSLEGATEFTPNDTNPNSTYGSLLLATDEDSKPMTLLCFSYTPINLVDIKNDKTTLKIDIKPGSDTNCINLKSCGVVPVAVLTTDDFNAGTLVPDYSILFAGASPVRSSLCDVDNDGDMDMLFHFRTQKLDLDENSTEATLTATLKSAVTMSSAATAGDVMEGTDKVKIMSSKKYSSSDKHAPKPKRYTSKHKQSSRNHKESDRNNKESDRNNKESGRNHKDR